MKFELKPYNRNIPDKGILEDLKRVATELKLDSLSKEEYNKNGRFSSSLVQRRFGSWARALELAELQIRKYSKVDHVELLKDIKRVANILNKKTVTTNEYNSLGKYGSSTFSRAFGSWFKALENAGLEKTRTLGVSNEDYFENLEVLWTKLGRQPNYAEIQKPFSKYCAGAYERRFGTWRKALEAFINYINSVELQNSEKEEIELQQNNLIKIQEKDIVHHLTKRNISSRLKVQVLMKDGNKCKLCGITVTGENIHFDHIKPWSKGGETILENLQVLCAEHNIAKSNLEYDEK
jgi:hypothetical protein